MSLGKGVARNSAVMASGTVVSRATGVLRDVAMTAALGLGIMSDAYSLGNTLPNIMYTLLIGGALQAVFVPQLVRHMKEDEDGGTAFADRLLTLSGIVLLVITVACVIAAPFLVGLYATDSYTQAQLDVAITFAYYCLPQIFFYGVFTMLSQVLYARERFGGPMFAPIINNVIAIAVFVMFIAVWGTSVVGGEVLTSQQIMLTGLGTTLGVVAQAVLLFPIAKRAGYRYRPRFQFRGFGLRKSYDLGKWTIGVVLLNQASALVNTRLATEANVVALANGYPANGLTTIQKAHLIFILPHSLVTVSLVTALLPGMSRMAHDGKLREIGDLVARAMRVVGAFVVPIGAIMIPLAPFIASLLFGYGAATASPENGQSALNSNDVLGFTVALYVLGLIPFTLYYVLIRGWYAMEDTKTVFLQGFLLNGVMIAAALFFFAQAPIVYSVAIAYSLAYWVTFLFAWRQLAKRLGHLDSRRTMWALFRMSCAGLIATAATWAVVVFSTGGDLSVSKFQQLIVISIAGAVGVAAYVLAAWVLRISEVSGGIAKVANRIRRR